MCDHPLPKCALRVWWSLNIIIPAPTVHVVILVTAMSKCASLPLSERSVFSKMAAWLCWWPNEHSLAHSHIEIKWLKANRSYWLPAYYSAIFITQKARYLPSWEKERESRRAVYVIRILFVRGSSAICAESASVAARRACNTPKSASTCCTPEPKTIDLFVGYQRFIFHTQIPIAPP